MKTLPTAILFLAATTVAVAAWTPIANWSGSGTKETESFNTTANEWRISWTASPVDPTFAGDGRFLVNITVMRGDLPVSTIQGGDRETSGVSYVRGTGRYYLKISSANARWTVAAEQP